MGWGSSTRRGGRRKVRALPRKFVFLGELGMSREFCRDVGDAWGCSKSLCKKKIVLTGRSKNLLETPPSKNPPGNFFSLKTPYKTPSEKFL